MKNIIKKIVEFLKQIFSKKENELGMALTEELNYRSKIKILIDNGHGINTSGKRSPYSMTGIEPKIPFLEYEWNREIANELVYELCFIGFDAELLVTEITDISLKERTQRVNKYCDELGKENVILISIHANAMGNGTKWEKATGWEAYTCLGKTESDNIAKFFYDAAEKYFSDKKIRYDWSDGDCDKEAGFYIIKNTKCPAILTENFFYDNIEDVKFITSKEGKRKIIDMHIDAIVNYLENKEGDC